MRRRGFTVLFGAILVVGLTILVGLANVPYVQVEPGPTYDTLGKGANGKDVIAISGTNTSTSKGQLRFVTIGARDELTVLDALRGWWRHEDAVVPRELLYPPQMTSQEVEQRNAEDFAQSESAAQSAALTELGYASEVQVGSVSAGQPAEGKLQANDVIKTINGQPVDSAQKLLDLIRAKPAGTELEIGYLRNGQAGTVKITTAAGTDGIPRIGVVPKIVQPHAFSLNVQVDNVGGPSAGLMLALGIVDKLQPEDLTGGKVIAGTGTIDEAGNVGPIGGVPQKLVAAKRDGAIIFLTPHDNCAEAVQNALPGLTLVEITSLDDALAQLKTIRSGGQPKLCAS